MGKVVSLYALERFSHLYNHKGKCLQTGHLRISLKFSFMEWQIIEKQYVVNSIAVQLETSAPVFPAASPFSYDDLAFHL